MRIQPAGVSDLFWKCFEDWADKNNVGDEHLDDWEPFFECFKSGGTAALYEANFPTSAFPFPKD